MDLQALSGKTLSVTSGSASPGPAPSTDALLCPYVNLLLCNAQPAGEKYILQKSPVKVLHSCLRWSLFWRNSKTFWKIIVVCRFFHCYFYDLWCLAAYQIFSCKYLFVFFSYTLCTIGYFKLLYKNASYRLQHMYRLCFVYTVKLESVQ